MSFDYAPGEVMKKIVRSLPPIEKAYAKVRFSIMRPRLLSVMDLLLTDEGDILDVGCGFGLFSAYFACMQPRRRITGLDTDGRRIEIATRVAKDLGIEHARFLLGDVRDVSLERKFDAIYVLDVMHHISAGQQSAVLERLTSILKPGGLLLIKDITTDPRRGMWFTWALDRLMVGPSAPLAYRHHSEWGELLEGLGFRVRMVRVPDVLPYPHVVIAATRRGERG